MGVLMRQSQDDILNRRIKVMRIVARMNVGGPAVQVSGLMRGLSATEFDHRLYTGYCSEDEADYIKEQAPDIQAIQLDGLGRKVSPRADFFILSKLIREIREFKPDVIHTHTAKAGVVGRIASILSFHPSKRVHTFHGHLLSGYFNPLITKIVILIEKMLALKTNILVSVGEKVRDELLEKKIGTLVKFRIFPPGLVLKNLVARDTALASLGLDPRFTYLTFIGRITQIKRPDRFLEMAEIVSSKNKKVKFLVAGGGDLLEKCKLIASDRGLPVIFLGWRSDIENILSASDIVVLTSDNEGTPISLIQAGLAGKPTVSTNVGSVQEIVLNGKTGLITELTPKALADAVNTLLVDEVFRTNLGAAANLHTQANYGVDRLVKDHTFLYKELISNLKQ
jgi:glycosyltransferase involved in cell wall biosynthesis